MDRSNAAPRSSLQKVASPWEGVLVLDDARVCFSRTGIRKHQRWE